MPAQEVIQQNDERTPLLRKHAPPTPLPTGQLFALSLLMVAEPLIGLSIVPYINEVCSSFLVWQQAQYSSNGQLVSQLPITGGDEKKVGYYAGIIVRNFRSEIMPRVIPHPLLVVALFYRRGCHHIAMEPSLRLYRTQTRYSQRHTGTSGDDRAVWFVANILGPSSKVMFLIESRLRPAHPIVVSQ